MVSVTRLWENCSDITYLSVHRLLGIKGNQMDTALQQDKNCWGQMHQAHGVQHRCDLLLRSTHCFLLGRVIKYFFKEARNNLIPKSVSGVFSKIFILTALIQFSSHKKLQLPLQMWTCKDSIFPLMEVFQKLISLL